MFSFLLSPSGRISRKQYWFGLLGITVFLIAIAAAGAFAVASSGGLASPIAIGVGGVVIFAYLFTTIATIMLTIKRLHDLGRSGLWLLALFVILIVLNVAAVSMAGIDLLDPTMTPDQMNQILAKRAADNPLLLVMLISPAILSLVFLVYLGFVRGTVGDNRFGADPTALSAV